MYAKLIGTDTKTAYRELTIGEVPNYHHSSYAHEMEPKTLSERHNVYFELLNMLSLSHKHKANLLNRGLDLSVIERNMYRSVPDKTHVEYIVKALSKRYDLSGIPGFYTYGGTWRMSLTDGLFIPVCTYNGLIQGLQIRLDNSNDRKYRWFSSRYKENGTRAYSWLHVANWRNNKTIYITEGALKTDVAAYLSQGECFVGLAGVNCLNEVIPLLKHLGVKEVIEAFDMDKSTNRHVTNAAKALKEKLWDSGITCQSYDWDKQFNGIDDFYLFSKWLDEAA